MYAHIMNPSFFPFFLFFFLSSESTLPRKLTEGPMPGIISLCWVATAQVLVPKRDAEEIITCLVWVLCWDLPDNPKWKVFSHVSDAEIDSNDPCLPLLHSRFEERGGKGLRCCFRGHAEQGGD